MKPNVPNESRLVFTDQLAEQPDLLRMYPYRYVMVASLLVEPGADNIWVARLLWAVETLEARGWEVAGWDSAPLMAPGGVVAGARLSHFAYMRRTAAPQSAPA